MTPDQGRFRVAPEHLQDVLNEHRLPETMAIAELGRDPDSGEVGMILSFAPQVAGMPSDMLASLMMQMAHELIQLAISHSDSDSVEQRHLELADLSLIDAGRAWKERQA